MKKNEIQTKWQLSLVGNSIEDKQFKKERVKQEKQIKAFARKWSRDTSYLTNPQKLLKSLKEYEQLIGGEHDFVNEPYYLQLRSALESGNARINAALKKCIDFYTPLHNKLTFYPLSLGKIDKKTQKEFLKDERLSHYHFFLSSLFKSARHHLSEKEENLTSLLQGVMADNWDDMTDEFLSESVEKVVVEEKGKLVEREQSFNQFLNNINNPIQEVRDSAASAVNRVFDKLGKVYEKEFNTFLERKKIYDNLRGYNRPDEYRHIADNISTKTVDTMLSVVQDNLALARDYYKFKAKLLDKKQLGYHERNVPVGKVEKKFTYHESINTVERAFSKLDSEFADYFRMFAREGRIDVYPRFGKTGGAFCAGASKDTPTYILLNHSDDLNSLTTLAHESGHGIHNELMRPVQSPVYCDTSLATAEVASTFCEEFALREAMQEMNEEEQFVAKAESFNGHISSIIRQSVFYFFEQDVHQEYREKGYLTKEEIGKIFKKHMKSYMGSGVSQDPGSENWWMYVGHFRRPFYVYSYASGEMISMALQQMVYDNPEDIEKIKQFLRAGSSESAEKLFKRVGIDIQKKEFWEQAFKKMHNDLRELKALARKLEKI